MAKYKPISRTDGFAFIFVRNDPKNRKTEQKTFPRGDPPPGNIFIKEIKEKALR